MTTPATTAMVDQSAAFVRDYLDSREFDWSADIRGAQVAILYLAEMYLLAKLRPDADVDALIGLALAAFMAVVDDA